MRHKLISLRSAREHHGDSVATARWAREVANKLIESNGQRWNETAVCRICEQGIISDEMKTERHVSGKIYLYGQQAAAAVVNEKITDPFRISEELAGMLLPFDPPLSAGLIRRFLEGFIDEIRNAESGADSYPLAPDDETKILAFFSFRFSDRMAGKILEPLILQPRFIDEPELFQQAFRVRDGAVRILTNKIAEDIDSYNRLTVTPHKSNWGNTLFPELLKSSIGVRISDMVEFGCVLGKKLRTKWNSEKPSPLELGEALKFLTVTDVDGHLPSRIIPVLKKVWGAVGVNYVPDASVTPSELGKLARGILLGINGLDVNGAAQIETRGKEDGFFFTRNDMLAFLGFMSVRFKNGVAARMLLRQAVKSLPREQSRSVYEKVIRIRQWVYDKIK